MKIKSFTDFKTRCTERFGQQATVSELEGGGFGVVLSTPEKRTGEKSMQMPGAAKFIPTPGTSERAEDETNNVIFSFSSETPVMNYWGEPEILSHHPDDANMDRFAEVGACLYNHNHDAITGKPVRVWIESLKGYCEEEFGTTETALKAKHEVLIDGTNRGISVGFIVREWVFLNSEQTFYRGIQGTEDGVWVASRWEALEASHTPVPADPSVGVGRSIADDQAQAEPSHQPEQRDNKPSTSDKVPSTKRKAPSTSDQALSTNHIQQERHMDKLKERAAALGLDPETATFEQVIAKEREAATKSADDRHKERQMADEQIRAIAGMHGAADLAEDAIKRGISPGEFGVELSAKQRAGTLSNPSANLDKDERQALEDFSITRFLAGATGALTGNGQALSGLEREISEEGFKECRDAGLSPEGIVLPQKVVRHLQNMQQRTQTAADLTSSGNMIDTTLMSGNFVDALRATTAIGQMGATFLTGLVGNITIPRQTNLLTGESLTEIEGSTAQDLETDLIALSPKRIGCEVEFSKQLLLQVNNPSVEAWNRSEVFSALSLKMDYDGLNGDGTGNAMLGLRNILTAISLGTDGAALDWANVVGLETAAATANALMGRLGYLTNAKVRGQLRTTLKAQAAGSSFIWEGTAEQSEVAGYHAVASNQVLGTTTTGASDNTSDIFFGNWSDLIVAQWGGVDFVLDPYTKASNAVVRLVANIWGDVDVRHPESFAYYSGVVTD